MTASATQRNLLLMGGDVLKYPALDDIPGSQQKGQPMEDFTASMKQEQAEIARYLSNTLVRSYYVSVIAASITAWTLMFNLGAYSEVFFRTLFAIWVLCSVIFVATLMLPPHERPLRGARLLVLLVPTLWVISFALAPLQSTATVALFRITSTVLTIGSLVTLPYVGYVILLITQGEALRLPSRMLFAMGAIVLVVSLAGYWVGANHQLFLTCHDFAVAGDFAPPNCVPR